jgi:OmpA-OmpF porin, OOP family
MRRRQVLLGAACLPVRAQEVTRVPLVAGLAVVTALHEPGVGDYESVKRLGARLQRPAPGWRIDYRASLPAEQVQSTRLQLDADLASATTYRSRFESDTEEHYPGSTALGVSSAVLRALRTPGSTPFTLVEATEWLRPPGGSGALALARSLTAGEVLLRGELRAAVPPAGTQRVLVNGRPVELPVRWAEGTLAARYGTRMAVRLALLDDDANPLALSWRIGGTQLTVVRLDWPRPDAGAALAAELQRLGRVALPGLYFDFGQAKLQPGSEATLSACVQALKTLPGRWRVEGHTDAVGSEQANRALSLARAQAVQQALAARAQVLAGRLEAVGLGASRPVGDNASADGRARNRRVELVQL